MSDQLADRLRKELQAAFMTARQKESHVPSPLPWSGTEGRYATRDIRHGAIRRGFSIIGSDDYQQEQLMDDIELLDGASA